MLGIMSNVTVLIVEDDPAIRNLYGDAFEHAGLTVLKACDGKEGVELALAHHPDAILMDIMMPVMNGHQAMSKIRKDTWGKNAKVVYLTNMSDAENVVHAVEHGSEEYIIKANASIKDVVNKVRMIMRA
jgi:two-component system KDP operon response regulator KdpE